MLSTSLFLLLLICSITSAVPLSSKVRSFGYSIKEGQLPTSIPVLIFEHNCSAPPCVITQLHFPDAIGHDWAVVSVNVYVDGDADAHRKASLVSSASTTTSLSFTLSDLAALNPISQTPSDGSPFGTPLFGKTASVGGIYSTIRIPFSTSIRITMAAPAARGSRLFWSIVRGVEATPTILGDYTLPAGARLRHSVINPTHFAPLEFVNMLDVPSGHDAAVVRVSVAGSSSTFHFLEACMRMMDTAQGTTRPANLTGAATYLSSGAEDYFLSAYYFDEGMFQTSQSGLTSFVRPSSRRPEHATPSRATGGVAMDADPYVMSAYKVHDRDPLFFRDGGSLVFRVGETVGGCGDTSVCPNTWCSPGESVGPAAGRALPRASPPQPTVYSTSVWYYEWPTDTGVAAAEAAERVENGSCPGGSAAVCVSQCPSALWAVCTAACADRCGV
eukprot:TRINITY_DN1525_c0_g1_i1.p1 TRINITY_DN1525_c0_g1~~TRINITY_DN1525_c0_g1_i1.p1  ORF type:complete len:464 (-),score=59.83 TRINITY_DN1525_c0_g1_i1:458-1789(-)